ncbi:hypothetical protein SAMD00019534_114860, partial [Acytostelium subglobosum LB1]|uniref:hypothetical protein n=1 Tax=Acytostelium subglobosum LB1 TaxID=1410327 RepID=UPI000644F31C
LFLNNDNVGEELVSKGNLPNTLKVLSINYVSIRNIEVGSLPSSLTKLDMGFHPDCRLKPGLLPNGLLHLHLSKDFDHELEPGCLPSSITNLSFGKNFNHIIEHGVLPPSITKLEFGDNFNQPLIVGVLPSTITSLKFGRLFIQPVTQDLWPPSLLNLIIGFNMFYFHLDKIPKPPPTLRYLDMHNTFDQCRFMTSCTSINVLRMNIKINPKVEEDIIGSLGVLIVPHNVRELIFNINSSLEFTKAYIWKVLSDNSKITSFQIETLSRRFEVRSLDQSRELAVCVCQIQDTCDDTTSKIRFFRLNLFLNSHSATSKNSIHTSQTAHFMNQMNMMMYQMYLMIHMDHL